MNYTCTTIYGLDVELLPPFPANSGHFRPTPAAAGDRQLSTVILLFSLSSFLPFSVSFFSSWFLFLFRLLHLENDSLFHSSPYLEILISFILNWEINDSHSVTSCLVGLQFWFHCWSYGELVVDSYVSSYIPLF